MNFDFPAFVYNYRRCKKNEFLSTAADRGGGDADKDFYKAPPDHYLLFLFRFLEKYFGLFWSLKTCSDHIEHLGKQKSHSAVTTERKAEAVESNPCCTFLYGLLLVVDLIYYCLVSFCIFRDQRLAWRRVRKKTPGSGWCFLFSKMQPPPPMKYYDSWK